MSEQSKLVTRQELYEAVWAKPITTLAKEWNTNYAQIVEACSLMEVPRPGSGHWQVIARGLLITPEPLPAPKPEAPAEMFFSPGGGRPGGARRAERQRMQAQDQDAAKETPLAGLEGKRSAPVAQKEQAKEFDLGKAAECSVLDVIRQATKVDFWADRIGAYHYVSGLRGLLGLDEDTKIPEGKLMNAVRNVRKEFRSFEVKVQNKEERYGRTAVGFEIEIHLRDGCEWRDAWEEAWSLAEKTNDHCLSDNALRLYLWAKGPKNTGKAVDRNKIGAQAKLRGTYSHIEDHLREIQLKTESGIQWEREEGRVWRSQLRVWFEPRRPAYYHYGPLNPSLGLDVREVKHAEAERFRTWLYAEMLKPEFPNGGEHVGVFDLSSRKALKAAFNPLPRSGGSYGDLGDFFKALRLMDGVDLRYYFKDGGGPWLVVCQPDEGASWRGIKDKFAAKTAEVPLQKKYKLSRDGLALLKWIVELRGEEYLRQMTPTVEDLLEKDIGIEADWDEENCRALVEVLIEELNEQTDYRLRAIPWRESGEVHTRILVKKKDSSWDIVVRSVQAFGLTKTGASRAEASRPQGRHSHPSICSRTAGRALRLPTRKTQLPPGARQSGAPLGSRLRLGRRNT